MAARLSAVPAPGRAGTAAPTSEGDRGMDRDATETTKWPWHLTNTDVIVRDPHHPDITGEWPVIGSPEFANGHTVITCDTGDGGEGYFVLTGAEQVTVRTGTTYTAVPLLTLEQREQALEAMATDTPDEVRHGELYRFAVVALAGWPEIFDAIHGRVDRHRDHVATTEKRPA